MARHIDTSDKPAKKYRLTHRDIVRTRLALDFMQGNRLSSDELMSTYYRDVTESSFHKTFKRDREALAHEGLMLMETRHGTAKTWELDRTHALASADASQSERRITAYLLSTLSQTPFPLPFREMGEAACRIGQDSVQPQSPTQIPSGIREVLEHLSEAFQTKHTCELNYQALSDTSPRIRKLNVYGLFDLGGTTYAVGLRQKEGAPNAMRTLNLSRVTHVRICWDDPCYTIPTGFDISDYRLLPFELGSDEIYTATFYVSAPAAPLFRQRARKRGSITENPDGSLIWSISVAASEKAAVWAVESGIYPLSPAHLVQTWETLLTRSAS